MGRTKKLDTVVDGNFPDGLDYASIFIKVTDQKLSEGSRNDLYLCCRLNFAADIVQTQAPQGMDLGLLTMNKLNKNSLLGTPDTRIKRLTDGSYWSTSDYVFGEATAVGMSAAKSDHDYNYKTDFEI